MSTRRQLVYFATATLTTVGLILLALDHAAHLPVLLAGLGVLYSGKFGSPARPVRSGSRMEWLLAGMVLLVMAGFEWHYMIARHSYPSLDEGLAGDGLDFRIGMVFLLWLLFFGLLVLRYGLERCMSNLPLDN